MEFPAACFPQLALAFVPKPVNPEPTNRQPAEDVPAFIRELAHGKNETIDFDVSLAEKPPWLDEARFRRGQKFASDHLFSVIYCEMLSLFMLFALRPISKVLVATGRSSTSVTAFRRYFGTAQKIISWYEEDVWCSGPARTNLALVRGLHRSVFKKLQASGNETPSPSSPSDAASSSFKDILLQDFREFCASDPAYHHLSMSSGLICLSQVDMAMTQFGFVGLAVTYPKQFGIHNVTDEELGDFIYMWRTLGYLLGIKDRYNFCMGDLATVRQRSRDVIDGVVKPALREIDAEWEHMARCLVGGMSLYTSRQSFDACVLYLCHVLEINTPRFRKSVSYKNRLSFYLRRFLFYLARIPFVSNYFNTGFKKEMKKIGEMSLEEFVEE